jgi:hypothetical protein
MAACIIGRPLLADIRSKVMSVYSRANKIEKPEVKHIHLWFGERIDKDDISIVDVTVCAWVNPPKEQITHNKELVTCDSCIRRAK